MQGAIAPAVLTDQSGQPVQIFVQVSGQGIEPLLEHDDDPEQDVGILDVFRSKAREEPGGGFSFENVTSSVTALAEAMTRALKAVAPDEGEVEFGIDVGVESGQLTSLLVKGTGNATLKVRLLWKKGDEQSAAAR
jgi:hypothetical protein